MSIRAAFSVNLFWMICSADLITEAAIKRIRKHLFLHLFYTRKFSKFIPVLCQNVAPKTGYFSFNSYTFQIIDICVRSLESEVRQLRLYFLA